MDEQTVAAAYDGIAAQYDALLEEDHWMRRVLWAHYAAVFPPGAHVLDVACGTGLDTLFLAERGIQVTGIDVAPQMIAQLQAKAQQRGLENRMTIQVEDIAALHTWPAARFDGIISAFAGLNTVHDLGAFAAAACRMLRPQGRMILHVLGPTDVWTQLGLIAHGQWGAARACRQRRQWTVVIAGQEVLHTLLVPAEMYARFFAPYFLLRRAYALGFLWPQGASGWLPAPLTYRLGQLEVCLGRHWPFRTWGRFCVLDLECVQPTLSPPDQ
jgi:2-polyprenyl-3-methyl-5-hydroxy-6-metoxy-1,4-benzoquinol methylase